ncbi:gastrula zinc finger protein XlCGF7.1-like [Centruroides vittatus]|uniref:gastrula zinc finger protein XlCGF7.1-like n=1 Tax=Centruroides vittatus TaxID=120091 RepID=UPI0035106A23
MCTRCNGSFSDPSTLKKHERTYTREKPYKCTSCNRGFSQSGNMLTHMSWACLNVQTDMYQISCHCCKKAFKDVKKLNSHLRREEIKSSVKYRCLTCQKNFVQKSALDNHRKIHLKVKPHTCTRCNRSFSDPSTLKKHERTHTREKPYKCTRCNRGFSQSGNMLRHMRTLARVQEDEVFYRSTKSTLTLV